MEKPRRHLASMVLLVLSLPGLILGMLTLIYPAVSDSGGGPSSGIHFILWGLMRLLGWAGLLLLTVAGIAALIESRNR